MNGFKVSYKMFDVENNEIFNDDLQNKSEWCQHGASIEEVFVEKFGKQLNVIINPEKVVSPYVLDLLNTKENIYSDLKTQNTPFFSSEKKFGIPPQYAVTFNEKDVIRYTKYLEEMNEIFIYFWVDWIPIKWTMGSRTIQVQPMKGVWGIRFSNILKILDEFELHDYQQRVNDKKGNAKRSYVLDLRHKKFARLK